MKGRNGQFKETDKNVKRILEMAGRGVSKRAVQRLCGFSNAYKAEIALQQVKARFGGEIVRVGNSLLFFKLPPSSVTQSVFRRTNVCGKYYEIQNYSNRKKK